MSPAGNPQHIPQYPPEPADTSPNNPTSADNLRHIPALDGLRGVAILFVLLWHYVDFSRSIFPGWAGVDLFFVLSGYLITGRLLASKGQPRYFSGFYRNRALRILPLYYTVVIGFFLAVHLLVSEGHQPLFSFYFQHWKSFFIFTQNWTFIFYGRPVTLPLLPLWSLAVEEQFYLVWPFIIFLTPGPSARTKIFIIGIGLILLLRTGSYLASPPSGESAYYNTFFRLDSLLAGSLLAQLHLARIRLNTCRVTAAAAASLILIILGCLIQTVEPYTPFFATIGYTTLALLFASILHLAVQPGNNALTTFLNGKFLRFCGRISYCLYLIHAPILSLIGTKLSLLGAHRWPEYAPFIRWLALFFCLALSFLLSALSYRYFESVFLRFKTRPPLAIQKDR